MRHYRNFLLGIVGFGMLVASALSPFAQSLDRIAGKWNNLSTGEIITITKGDLGGWDAELSDSGQARITQANSFGANIVVTMRRGNACYYYASFLNDYTNMNWQIRSGGSECLRGMFAKVLPGRSEATNPTAGDREGEATFEKSNEKTFDRLWVKAGADIVYMDFCFDKSMNVCGKEAADLFCQKKDYSKANYFKSEPQRCRISYQLMGQFPNAEMREWYNNNPCRPSDNFKIFTEITCGK